MGPRAGFLVVGLSVAAVTLSAQRRDPDTISVDSARALLGTDPLAIPDLPVRAIYALPGEAVLVEQEDESGQMMSFREQRGGPSNLMRRPADSIRNSPRSVENAFLHSEAAEWRLESRRRHRYIEPLNVRVMSNRGRIGDWEAWLDRLAPLRR